MKRVLPICLSLLMACSLAGCGGNKEKAKEDVKKEATKTTSKTEQKIQSKTTVVTDKKFNHTASLKMQQVVAPISEIDDPIAVVYEKEALIAYKLKDEAKAEVAEKKLRQKLKSDMPDYQIRIGNHPDWYKQVEVLHQDTIDSGGRTMKNLKASFDALRKKRE